MLISFGSLQKSWEATHFPISACCLLKICLRFLANKWSKQQIDWKAWPGHDFPPNSPTPCKFKAVAGFSQCDHVHPSPPDIQNFPPPPRNYSNMQMNFSVYGQISYTLESAITSTKVPTQLPTAKAVCFVSFSWNPQFRTGLCTQQVFSREWWQNPANKCTVLCGLIWYWPRFESVQPPTPSSLMSAGGFANHSTAVLNNQVQKSSLQVTANAQSSWVLLSCGLFRCQTPPLNRTGHRPDQRPHALPSARSPALRRPSPAAR